MEKLLASLIIEILGRPEETVKEALQSMVTRLGAEKGIKIVKKNYHDPKKVEKSADLFTAFVEIEVELDSISNYFGIIFAYMPSHIELIYPENVSLSNSALNEYGNALAQRLHHYDSVTKNALVEREIVLHKLKEVSPEEFKKLTTPRESKEDSSQQS